MNFLHPELLKLLWLLAGLGLLLALFGWRLWRAHARAVEAHLASGQGPWLSPWLLGLKLALWLAGGWFLVQALMVPQGQPVKLESETFGAEIVVAVDVSTSMYCQDVRPNRLAAAKQVLGDLIDRMGGDRVGLVAFAGEAVMACPMTTDYETARLFLDKLESDSVPADGTGLAKAIAASLDRFGEARDRGRLIVLATDGEDLAGSGADEQARRAGQMGVPILAVGVGTRQGGLVPGQRDAFGRVLAKTWEGRPVTSRLDEATLRRVAELSGGEFLRADSAAAAGRIIERAKALKQSKAKAPDRWVREPLYQRPLLIALALFLLEFVLPLRSGGLRRHVSRVWGALAGLWSLIRRRRGWGGAAAVALMLLAAPLAAFSLDPGREEYDKGNAAYQASDFDGASKLYRDSLQENDKRGWAHYNLGNALFRQGDYNAAAGEYEQALKIDPKDEDAAFNLDLARRKQQEQDQNQNQGQKGGQNKDGKQGQGKQGQNGQGGGQGKQGQQGQQGQQGKGQNGQAGQKSRLDSDQAAAMMRMMKNDQAKYGQAFNPHRRYDKQQNRQDPFDQMWEQMTGQKPPQAQQQGPGETRKDW